MKRKLMLMLLALSALSCKKGTIMDKGLSPDKEMNLKSQTMIANSSAQVLSGNYVNVKDYGALGNGDHDDTQAIRNAMTFAKLNNRKTVYFPEGTYLIAGESDGPGIIKLLNGVSLQGDGSIESKIILSGGRHNPKAIFYQAWWEEPVVSNIKVDGLTFDGNLSKQTFEPLYEYSHALSINNGANIEVSNCKFQSLRGDGLLFGDTDEPSPNIRVTSNVNVHDNDFYNIHREGVMFCCTQTAYFHDNVLHGNGFYVGGVDIERHSVNESVKNVAVYNNVFDFREGQGPIERGPQVKFRRAITMGFFYKGYLNGIADGESAGHKIYNNTIYQGQIDCFGHTDVSIIANRIANFYENLDKVQFITPSAIHISDAGTTSGLNRIQVLNNNIYSLMNGNGIFCYRYNAVAMSYNAITGTKMPGINILSSGGDFTYNTITDVGTIANNAPGFIINGECNNLLITNNTIKDTRSGNSRTVNFGIAIQSLNKSTTAPRIQNNKAVNLIAEFISEFYLQKNYVVLSGNVAE